MPTAYLSLGSNLGDREAQFEAALRMLGSGGQVNIVRVSTYHETTPIGGPSLQPNFLNAAVEIQTSLAPHELLRELQRIEHALGRRRDLRWGPRTLDLDLLLYNQQVLDSPALQVPHPRMHVRRFVLQPLAEIAPEACHPILGWSVQRLLNHFNRLPRYLAITDLDDQNLDLGPILQKIAQNTGAELIHEGRRLSPPTFPADSTRQILDGYVEWLAQCTDWLSQPRWSISTSPWLVSHGWLNQGWLAAQRQLSGEPWFRFRTFWQQAQTQILKPTLLVWLDHSPGVGMPYRSPSATTGKPAATSSGVKTERNKWLRYLEEQRPLPWLQLKSPDESVVSEVVAAMQAISG